MVLIINIVILIIITNFCIVCLSLPTLSLLFLSDKITNSSETFGEQEAIELMDVLTQYLGETNSFINFIFVTRLTLNRLDLRTEQPLCILLCTFEFARGKKTVPVIDRVLFSW